MSYPSSLATCLTLLLALCADSRACSVFCLPTDDGPVFGRNYDWHFGDGVLVVNKRQISKTAISRSRPAAWTSTYGSVTFNQYGREFPCGGMNESGLVVVVLWHRGAKYPAPDDRRSVNTLQWVQYQLDTASSVADVLRSDKEIRIESISGARLHYFVGDRKGNCATIDFINGKRICHTGSSLPAQVLTNSAYATSHSELSKYAGFGGRQPIANAKPGQRFVRAAHLIRQQPTNGDPIDHAFSVLKRIAQGSYTQWSIVYDTRKSVIHFRTKDAAQVRSVDLRQLDFSPTSAVTTLDINAKISGNATDKFVRYSPRQNRALIAKSFAATPLTRSMPRSMVDRLASYPETCKVAAEKKKKKKKK